MTIKKTTVCFLLAFITLNVFGDDLNDVVKEAERVVNNLFHDEKVNELFKARLQSEVI